MNAASLSRRAFLGHTALAAGAPLLVGHNALLAAVRSATPDMPELRDWDAVRAQFKLSPQYRHFASFFLASHPTPVRRALEGFRDALDTNPFLTVEHGLFDPESENFELTARRAAADYLGGRVEEVALVHNTTTALALVYHGLPLQAGDELLLTTHDHYAHHESARLAARRAGATLRKVPLFASSRDATEDEIVANVRAAIGPKTRVLGITWVHSSSGIRLPVRAIAAAVAAINAERPAEQRVRLVVDGVHGIGAVHETIATLGCDYFCAGTHKWIFGPRGTGIIWAHQAAWAELRPTIPTFSSEESYTAWEQGRDPAGPTRADQVIPGGFQAFEHQWALAAAFGMHRAIGPERVGARIAELNSRCKAGLAEIPKVVQHTPMAPALSAGICCFEVAGMAPAEVVKQLLARGFIASTSPYAVTYVRLAGSLLNTPEEVDAALAAVAEIAAGAA
jgi:isopenicillin-N epimerase